MKKQNKNEQNLPLNIDELNELELAKLKGGRRQKDFVGLGCTVTNTVSGCGSSSGNGGK